MKSLRLRPVYYPSRHSKEFFKGGWGLLIAPVIGGAIVALALGLPGRAQPLPRALPQTAAIAAQEVKQLQRQLAQVGLYQGAIDGVFGPETAQAVRSLQQQQGLIVDGVMGPQTQAALATLAQGQFITLPSPPILSFTPLVIAPPPSPPSALWLALMPLVPITGGALTYLHQQLRRHWRLRQRRRLSSPPGPPR
jgi:hypothetical protein